MLAPHDVVPFLSSGDQIVREQAVAYFDYASDFGDLTADGVWAAIDAVGLPAARSSGLISLLRQVPQTDASTGRLLAALDANRDDKTLRGDLVEEVHFMPCEQLRRHADRVLAREDLPQSTRTHLTERLRLAQLPVDELLAMLFEKPVDEPDENDATAEDASKVGASGEVVDDMDADDDADFEDEADFEDDPDDEENDDVSKKFRILGVLAALDADAVGAGALAILNDPAYRDSEAEDYAVDLLGRVRYRPALPRLLERFAEANDTTTSDFLLEGMQDAVPRIGGADAVAAIEAAFTRASSSYRIYAAEALGRIKHPSAEAALQRLLADPGAEDAWDELAHAMLKLLSRDALPALHKEIVIDGNYSGMIFDLERELVACALITAFDFPELGSMREEAVARQVEDEDRFTRGQFVGADDDYDDDDDDDDDDDYDDWEDDEPGYAALPERLDDRYPPPTPTIRNEQPKVGRNDPCPCGSGKKYKKCCLGKS